MGGWAWWAAVHGVAKSQTWLSDFTFTFHFHALEKEMVTHSSVLAWRIPGMGEPGGLPSMGSHRVRHNWSDLVAAAAENILKNMDPLKAFLKFISETLMFLHLLAMTKLSITFNFFIIFDFFSLSFQFSFRYSIQKKELLDLHLKTCFTSGLCSLWLRNLGKSHLLYLGLVSSFVKW